MRSIHSRLLVAAGAALLVAAPAVHAQSAFNGRVREVASARLDSVQVERARQLLDRAQQRWYDYDLKGARRDFAHASEIMIQQNVYAGPTLVSLAHATYALGQAE